ncbi:MAG: integrative conjugative element protein, RAQPRD family [Gammaproteobacteria bacterium]
MHKTIAAISLLAVFAFSSSPASADADAEKTALAKIMHELDALKPLIASARAQADDDARIRFQYDWLALDLDRIKLGIQEHLAAPQATPRSFPPLKGDYRR